MTPLLNRLQTLLLAAQLPGLNREAVTLYIAEAQPHYSIPYDPDHQLPADEPITLELTPPATLVIKPFEGDLLDLILTLELILDELAPNSRGNANRLTISAEPLSDSSAVLVISFKLRERIRYVPSEAGNLTINGIHYRRESIPENPLLTPLSQIVYVGQS